MFPAKYINCKQITKKMGNRNSKISTYILDWGSGYSKQALNDVKIIFYDSKIYVPQNLCRRVLDWYHFHLNHPGDSRLAKTIREVCYWKCLVVQSGLYAKLCNICQHFKKRKTIYGYLPPKNIVELKTSNLLHIDLIGPYRNYIRQ